MTIQRSAHPVFATGWAVLTLLALVAGVIGHLGYRQGVFASSVLGGIIVLEAIAVRYKGQKKLRDTWSEITTLVNRYLSKHREPGVGWNTLIIVQALILWRLIYVVGVFWGGVEVAVYVAVTGAIFAKGQHDHWLDPESNG